MNSFTVTAQAARPLPISKDHEHGFDDYLKSVRRHFEASLSDGGGHLFRTDAEGLFETYLDNLPQPDRQYHTCNCCRKFFENYGGLVVIDDAGRTHSAVWNFHDAPEYYRRAIEAVRLKVARARVKGVFISNEKTWGDPVTGVWTHYAVKHPNPPARHLLLTAGQLMAEKLEDYGTLRRGLAEFNKDLVGQALQILKSDSLFRAEKVLGPAQFLYDLYEKLAETPKNLHANIVWKAVAWAPTGFCKPRSTMIGTLLEDLAAGMSFEAASRRFRDKMHPLQYQRPQAAPAAGNIAQAEKLVEQMGIAASLRRRFARVEEVETLWRPRPVAASGGEQGGVFGHLTPKGSLKPGTIDVVGASAKPMTWEKFSRTILPDAERIEFYAARKNDAYTALVTAADPDAPPIIQWDEPEARNPVSLYVYHGGSTPASFSLAAGYWHEVTAVTKAPWLWNGRKPMNMSNSAILLLKGAKDTRYGGLALFPEILRSDFSS